VTASNFTRATSVTDRPNCAHLIPPQQPFDEPRVYNSSEPAPPKFRSGLATAAGFTGLALVFSRFSIAPLIWSQFPGVFDVSRPDQAALARLFLLLIPLPGMVAPVALWLGVNAFRELNQHPGGTGRIQAGFAVVIGFIGTVILVSEICQVAITLLNPI